MEEIKLKVHYNKSVICPYCNKAPPWIENKEIFGKNIGVSYMCYYCRPCDPYVGCYANTRKPNGTMANRELRNLRKKAHHYVNRLWQSLDQRKRVYMDMAVHFGNNVHIGASSEDVCKRVIGYAKYIA